MENENRSTALVQATSTALVQTQERPPSYWVRVSRKYHTAWMIVAFVLVLFLVMFSVLFAHAFSYDSLFYFGKDIATLTSLPDQGDTTVYYDYKGEDAVPVSYRGGMAVAHAGGVDIYAANSGRLLSVAFETPYAAPRIAVSRDYLIAYDFGATSFCVCNSYDMLYEGVTEQPIYGIYVSNSGYFTIITRSDIALSEVLVFDADFNLKQRFRRASATVSAVISENGRTVTLVGAVAEGALVDVYMIGDEVPLSSTVLAGLPLAAGYTASTKLAVITDTACHVISHEGKVYETVGFDGASLVAYSVSENGIALALETDRINAAYRVLALDKKGRIQTELAHSGRVKALSLSDSCLWMLCDRDAVCIRLDNAQMIDKLTVDDGALDIVALGDRNARVLYPAQALYFKIDR
ncbi:MAG: hypothetical protein IJC95_04925 [Clostridia bacterium]|nr:hypothetical protein [Clostridia bacterium]